MAPNKGLTPACYARALRDAGGCVTEAARLLGVVPSAVSRVAKSHGLRVNQPGAPSRERVCWIEGVDDILKIGDREFTTLWADVGCKHLSELLDVSKATVSGKALRLGARGRR